MKGDLAIYSTVADFQLHLPQTSKYPDNQKRLHSQGIKFKSIDIVP